MTALEKYELDTAAHLACPGARRHFSTVTSGSLKSSASKSSASNRTVSSPARSVVSVMNSETLPIDPAMSFWVRHSDCSTAKRCLRGASARFFTASSSSISKGRSVVRNVLCTSTESSRYDREQALLRLGGDLPIQIIEGDLLVGLLRDAQVRPERHARLERRGHEIDGLVAPLDHERVLLVLHHDVLEGGATGAHFHAEARTGKLADRLGLALFSGRSQVVPRAKRLHLSGAPFALLTRDQGQAELDQQEHGHADQNPSEYATSFHVR